MSEREKLQLVSEVNILRELKHPNIVRYDERYLDKNAHIIYIVMEYCENGDLASFIKIKREREKIYLDEEMIWKLFTQILCGLHECHSTSIEKQNENQLASFSSKDVNEYASFQSLSAKNMRNDTPGSTVILHRDLKPENIFLDSQLTAKIGDFGLSKIISTQFEFGKTFVGTPYYMSPVNPMNESKSV